MILMIETWYRQPLFDSSLDFIERIQKDASEAVAVTWEIYSNLGVFSLIAIPPVALYIIWWKRMHSFYYVIMITSMLAMMNITKLWYHEARPFWVRDNIEAYGCSTQYGNPSGHSLFSMGAAMSIWLDFNERFKDRQGSRF